LRRSPVAQLCNSLDAVSPRPLSGRRMVRIPLVSGFAVERENRPVRRQFAIEALGDPVVAIGHHDVLREPAQSRLAGFDGAVKHDAARRQEVGKENFQGFPRNVLRTARSSVRL
jgi:hypothetical protein